MTSDRAKFYGTMKKPGEIAQLKGIEMKPDKRMKQIPRNLEKVSPEDREDVEKKNVTVR